jgi:hypothetical protein
MADGVKARVGLGVGVTQGRAPEGDRGIGTAASRFDGRAGREGSGETDDVAVAFGGLLVGEYGLFGLFRPPQFQQRVRVIGVGLGDVGRAGVAAFCW